MKKSIIEKITDSKTMSAIISIKFVLSIIGGIISFIVCAAILLNFTHLYKAVSTGNFDGVSVPQQFIDAQQAREEAKAAIAERKAQMQSSIERGQALQEQYNAAFEQFQATKDAIEGAQSPISQTDGTQVTETPSTEAANNN